jgi:FAD/FMN-containing dehydrogenase
MWSNWSRGQSCAPAEHVRPASRAELSEAVARGRAVRVAGAGHSFSGVVPTDGTLLSLDRLDRVLDVDRVSGLVRAEAGIRLHRLVRELHATASRSRTSGTSTPSRSPARSSPARTGRAGSSATWRRASRRWSSCSPTAPS